MVARTGKQFLAGLAADREVWLEGERVHSIVDHAAFNGAANALADVYDLQHTHADDCLMPDPETGELINVSHPVPRSIEELEGGEGGLSLISKYSIALMVRTPDYGSAT